MNINGLIALSATAKTAVNERLNWDVESQGEYRGEVSDAEYDIFRRVAHHAVVSEMFKTPTFTGKTWFLFSLTFADPNGKLQAAVDYLVANRNNHFKIIGVWWWDGRQFGTQWTDETQTETMGTPTYPIAAQALDFMPDEVLADVNLLQGQKPRRWT